MLYLGKWAVEFYEHRYHACGQYSHKINRSENEGKSQNSREAVRILQRKICVLAGNRIQDHMICATILLVFNKSSPRSLLSSELVC